MIVTYHGWIVVESSPGYKDRFYAEYTEHGERKTSESFTSPAQVVEWWDKRVGEPVKLVQLPVGAYRVYTGDLS